MNNSLLNEALEYHRRGWCIISVLYGKKEPIIKWGQYQKMRPDENTIRQWFTGG